MAVTHRCFCARGQASLGPSCTRHVRCTVSPHRSCGRGEAHPPACGLRPQRAAHPPGCSGSPGAAPGAGAPADAGARAPRPPRKSGRSHRPGAQEGGPPGPETACPRPGPNRRSARTAPRTGPPAPACGAPAGSRHIPARPGPGRPASAPDRPLAWRRQRGRGGVRPSRVGAARLLCAPHSLHTGVGVPSCLTPSRPVCDAMGRYGGRFMYRRSSLVHTGRNAGLRCLGFEPTAWKTACVSAAHAGSHTSTAIIYPC